MNPKIKLLVFSKYDTLGASSRLRSIQYFESLEHENIEVTLSPLFDNRYLKRLYRGEKSSFNYIFKRYFKRFLQLFHLKKYDVIWIEKELFPWIPFNIEGLLKRLGINYMVDYDDAIFHNYDSHSKSLVRLLLKNKIPNVMKNATIVTLCNSYLEKKALASGAQRVELLPTVVSLKRYYLQEKKLHQKPLKIGWIGTPVTEKYIIDLRTMFERLHHEIEFELFIIGGKNFHSTLLHYTLVPWTEASEVELISALDIGIMPLNDSKWEKGKCGYKLIQYMACQKPVIASAVGMNSEIIQDGYNGYLVKNEDEWIEAFKELSNENKRELLGKNARKTVEEKYSLEITKQQRIFYIFDILKESR